MTTNRVNRAPAIPQDSTRVQATTAAAEAVAAGLGGVGVLVADLPASPAVGARAFALDALAPAFGAAVVGGGAVPVPVYYDGSAWAVG